MWAGRSGPPVFLSGHAGSSRPLQIQIGGSAGMKMRPLRDRILVERIEEAEQRVGGIIIPDTAKEKPQSGRVIAVGKGRINDKGQVFPLDVKEGETVLFGKYAGSEIKIDGREYLILREDDVLGVLEGKPDRKSTRLNSS